MHLQTKQQDNQFFLLAKSYETQGARNDGWRYFVVVIFFLFNWLIVGSWLVFWILYLLKVDNQEPLLALSKLGIQKPVLSYLLLNLNFFFGLASLLLGVKYLHKRPLRSLITWRQQINFVKIIFSFVVYFLFCLTGALSMFWLNNGQFSWNPHFNWLRWPNWWFLPLALLVTGIQVLLEEIFFRAYLIQWFSLGINNKWLVVCLVSCLFAFLHLTNPENTLSWLVSLHYFLVGLFLTILVAKDQSLELAIGCHLANNLFGVLLVSYLDGALPSATGLIILENIRWTWFETVFNFVGFVFLYLILSSWTFITSWAFDQKLARKISKTLVNN